MHQLLMRCWFSVNFEHQLGNGFSNLSKFYPEGFKGAMTDDLELGFWITLQDFCKPADGIPCAETWSNRTGDTKAKPVFSMELQGLRRACLSLKFIFQNQKRPLFWHFRDIAFFCQKK